MANNVMEADQKRKDPFCVDKNLKSWASPRVVARGAAYYRQGHVQSLESLNDRIEAQVEGTQTEPYKIEIAFDEGGRPKSQCSCPFNWEPLCKHAVAVLLAWQQEETGSEPILGPLPSSDGKTFVDDLEDRNRYLEELAQVEREERRSRSKEQDLKIVTKPSRGLLGDYGVTTASPHRKEGIYRVTIRDGEFKHASCDCLDFRKNELGTCKHVELVRRRLEAKTRAKALAEEVLSDSHLYVYLASRPSQNKILQPFENIRFYVTPRLKHKLQPLLSEWSDREGWYLSPAGSPCSSGGNGHEAVGIETQFKKMAARFGSLAGPGAIHVDEQVWQLLRREEEQRRWEQLLNSALKPEMSLKLHPYQTEGIRFAVKKRHAFIGDEMGLGKTVQAIGAALLLKKMGEVKKTLIVAPASLKFQWKREIEKFSREQALIISGGARQRDEQYRSAREFFVIINYELLYRDLGSILKLKPDYVILDEAQRIKNWETKIAQTIKRLESSFKLVLTGTPLENRLPELQSIAEFLDPRALGAPWKLIPTYAKLDENDKITGYTRLDHLRQRLSSFLIRRNRKEVLSQLPGRTDKNFWTALTSEQHDVHDMLAAQVTKLVRKWEKFKRLTREDMQRLFMKLTCMRIVCNAYGQYDWKPLELEVLSTRQASASLKKRIGSPKLEEFAQVMADLLENPHQKVVVFSQWERMIRLGDLYIRSILNQHASRSVIFCGALSLKKRDAEIKRFLSDPATRVFFSTDAGGVGLNLQEAANCVVNLEIPWNPAVLEQRVGRVYRMGQKKPVQVINFVSSESIEERIFNLVSHKKALFAGVFDEKTIEIRFGKGQQVSFMDKVGKIVPATAKDAAPERKENEILEPAEAIGDSVASVARREAQVPTPDARPFLEIDLGPALSSLAALSGGTSKEGIADASSSPLAELGGTAGPPEAGTPARVTARVSQDEQGVHLVLPKPAVELLGRLRPLLETLIKLAGESGSRQS
ncbi:MAG: DEAD/DEAH box helicase family protein [Elusimicrobia bacterium]|nr:DEAD/DEAH box helicase family protein [Elusimicrobiota bacterium]